MYKKTFVLLCCLGLAACAHDGDAGSWWRFTGKSAVQDVPKIDHELTNAWLDEYEPRLKDALNGSKMEVERRENVLVVTAPVNGSFNPDRPSMLLPAVLGPFTKVAKMVEGDKNTGILILGHADSSGQVDSNRQLSEDRAKAVASIFRLSGLQRDRLLLKGVGSDMPRAANDSAAGRALNRRVEIVLTPQKTLTALLAHYSQPAPATASNTGVVAQVAADQKNKGKAE